MIILIDLNKRFVLVLVVVDTQESSIGSILLRCDQIHLLITKLKVEVRI